MRNHEWGLSYNDVHLRPEGRRLSSSASIDSLATMEATALAHATSSRFILLSSPMSTGTSTDVCRDDEASSPRPLTTNHELAAPTSWAPCLLTSWLLIESRNHHQVAGSAPGRTSWRKQILVAWDFARLSALPPCCS
jgi:hypothetical protein